MAIVWLIYSLILLIFFVIGWTCVYHAKKYGMPRDLTKKATMIYLALMLLIIVISIVIVLQNGADAPLNFHNIRLIK